MLYSYPLKAKEASLQLSVLSPVFLFQFLIWVQLTHWFLFLLWSKYSTESTWQNSACMPLICKSCNTQNSIPSPFHLANFPVLSLFPHAFLLRKFFHRLDGFDSLYLFRECGLFQNTRLLNPTLWNILGMAEKGVSTNILGSLSAISLRPYAIICLRYFSSLSAGCLCVYLPKSTQPCFHHAGGVLTCTPPFRHSLTAALAFSRRYVTPVRAALR